MSDVYRNFKYEVEIGGFVRAGFSKISGLKHNVEVVEYREGADNETPRKLSGQSTFDNITMERGLSTDSDFVDWIQMVFNLDNAGGMQDNGVGDNFRKLMIIYLKDKSGVRVKKWVCYKCWPTSNGVGDLDASGNDVLIESLEIANEGIKFESLT